MLAFPNAKINIGLNILNRREDGYHNIESVFYPVSLRDGLEVMTCEEGETEMHLSGIPVDGDTRKNLVYKAWELLHRDYGIGPASIYLHKQIPMGAGLGGGSADCAFAIQLLSQVFELNLSTEKMEEHALELGSDCPFFIQNIPQLVTGRGELMTPFVLKLSGWHLLLANPGIHVSTQVAYSQVVPCDPEVSLAEALQHPVAEWPGLVKNQFETSVFPQFPTIERLKETLYDRGAAYASMTGSGSTVFGLFQTLPELSGLGCDFVWTAELD